MQRTNPWPVFDGNGLFVYAPGLAHRVPLLGNSAPPRSGTVRALRNSFERVVLRWPTALGWVAIEVGVNR